MTEETKVVKAPTFHGITFDEEMSQIVLGVYRDGDRLNEETIPKELMERLRDRAAKSVRSGRKTMRIHTTMSHEMQIPDIPEGATGEELVDILTRPVPCPVPFADRLKGILDMLDANEADEADRVSVRRSSCRSLLDQVDKVTDLACRLDYLKLVSSKGIDEDLRKALCELRDAAVGLDVARLPLKSQITNGTGEFPADLLS